MFTKKKKTVKEEIKDAEKVNRSGARDLEHHVRILEKEEAKLVQQIKLAAKQGPEAATPLAKQLVKLRQQKTRLKGQAAHLKGLSTAMKTSAAVHNTAQAMGASAAAMGKVSTAMNPQQVIADLQEFTKQNEKMEMTSDIMDDAIEGVFDNQEGEADALVSQVLDEVGIDAVTGAVSAPKTKVATATPAAVDVEDEEINKMLHSLKS